MPDVFRDPHYASRDMLVDVDDAELGTVKQANVVPKLSDTPGVIRHAGGQVGVDTRALLMERCGLDAAMVKSLEDDGVVYCGAATPDVASETGN